MTAYKITRTVSLVLCAFLVAVGSLIALSAYAGELEVAVLAVLIVGGLSVVLWRVWRTPSS